MDRAAAKAPAAAAAAAAAAAFIYGKCSTSWSLTVP
eukprot:SAG22_NODE_458_length_10257_cov_4.533373_1_plen_35_part_10